MPILSKDELNEEYKKYDLIGGESSKIISFDTANLGDLARDISSTNNATKNAAMLFVEEVNDLKMQPMISAYHVIELMAHAENDVVRNRINLLSMFDNVITIKSKHREIGYAGTLTDVLDGELRSYLKPYKKDLKQVARDSIGKILERRTGVKFVEALLQDIAILSQAAKYQLAENMNHVAKMELIEEENQNTPIRTLIERAEGRVLDPRIVAEVEKRNAEIFLQRGDKRIIDPSRVAKTHTMNVIELLVAYSRHHRNPVKAMLIDGVFSDEDVEREVTLGGINDLGDFRRQIRLTERGENLAYSMLLSLDRFKFPWHNVQSGFKRFFQRTGEHKGSNLYDRYALSLSPYCHLLTCDKRTMENIKRASNGDERFKNSVGIIKKSSSYQSSLELARELDTQVPMRP